MRPGLTKTLSLADALDAMPDSPLPFLSAERVLDIKLGLFKSQMPSVAAALYGEDPRSHGERFARIMLRSRERQPAGQKKRLIAAARRISQEEFPAVGDRPAAKVTGFFVLLANIIESMVRDQWVTFGVATCAIWVMMTLAFRSPLLAILALIPNILPILAITGLMGWLNRLGWREAKINMGAAMIAAVSVGLAIDSSIHYISALRRLQRQGKSFDAALDSVQQSVGRAASFSTLALIVGFSALCFSEFVPIVYFGVLVSLAMLGGLLGNLVLLPLLLRYAARRD